MVMQPERDVRSLFGHELWDSGMPLGWREEGLGAGYAWGRVAKLCEWRVSELQ